MINTFQRSLLTAQDSHFFPENLTFLNWEIKFIKIIPILY